VYFDYLMNGIPVWTGGRHAAVFTVSDGSLESAEFNFCSYSLTGQDLEILPMYQAAAIASANRCNEFSLMYFDTQENIECFWVNE